MNSRIEPPRVRARLRFQRLAVPGVIGVVESQDVWYAQLGVDAGWPIFQPMDDWKTEVLLVEMRALTLEDRSVFKRELPDVALAEALATNADMESYEFPPIHSEEELRSLRLASAARLLVVSEAEQQALQARGVPVYRAGYHRGPSVLSVEIVDGKKRAPAQVSAFEVSRTPLPQDLPAGLSPRQFRALFTARWIDRALRVLTQGVITEGAVQLARYCAHGPRSFDLIEDELTVAAISAATLMSTVSNDLELPLHGRARKVPLPSFVLPISYEHKPGGPGAPSAHSQVEVPPEDCWLIVGR